MAEKKTIVTYKGLKDIEGELQDLKVNKRREIAAKIKEAREQGEAILKNVEVVDEDEVDTDTVGIGCTVKVFDYEFDEEIVYDIVGSTQADIMKNKISDESPVGMALKGAKVGSEVTVEAPDGEFKYRVLEIKRQEM